MSIKFGVHKRKKGKAKQTFLKYPSLSFESVYEMKDILKMDNTPAEIISILVEEGVNAFNLDNLEVSKRDKKADKGQLDYYVQPTIEMLGQDKKY